MTAATTVVHAPSCGYGPRFPNLLRSERTKFRTLRSTWWSLGIAAVLSVGLSIVVCAVEIADWSSHSVEGKANFVNDTIGDIVQPAFDFSALVISVLAVMMMASEHSTGMIKATVLAAPRRTPVLAAKAVVLAVTVFVLAEVLIFIAFGIDSVIVRSHATITLGTPGTIRALLGFGVVMAMIALIGLAIGALFRHTAVGITVMLGLNLVLPGLLLLVPGSAGRHLSDAMPYSSGQFIMQRTLDAEASYGPWSGLAITAAWTVVLLGAAFVAVKRRDV